MLTCQDLREVYRMGEVDVRALDGVDAIKREVVRAPCAASSEKVAVQARFASVTRAPTDA